MARSLFCALVGSLSFAAAGALGGCDDETSLPSLGFSFDAGAFAWDAMAGDASGGSPETKLTVTPNAVSNQANARFEFTSTPAGSFVCRLDAAEAAPCTSPHDVAVAEGAHTFEVSAFAAGKIDVTPERFSWRVDLTAPVTTITSAPPNPNNSATATFTFTTSEPATTSCALDSNAPAPCTSPFEVRGLGEGAHTLTIATTDPAGNAGTPATHAWNVDLSTPETVIDSGPSGAVDTKSATFRFSSPNAGAGATFSCSLGAAAFTTCTSPITYSGLAEGPARFRVRVTDRANNTDITPAERNWTVDTVPPTVTLVGGPTGTINDATPGPFTFTTGGGATSTECRFDVAAFAPCTSPFTAAAALAGGAHTFEVRSIDAAGNVSSPTATRAFTIDVVAPVLSNLSYDFPYPWTVLDFAFTVSEPSTIQYRFCNKPDFATPCTPSGGFTAWAAPYLLTPPTSGPGYYTIQIRATDAAGNVGDGYLDFSTIVITRREAPERRRDLRTPPPVRWTFWSLPDERPAGRSAERRARPSRPGRIPS